MKSQRINEITSRVTKNLKRFYHYFLLDKLLVRKNIRFIRETYKGNKVLICILHTYKTAERASYLKSYYDNKADFFFYADYEKLEDRVVKVSHADYYASNELKHINVLNLIRRSKAYERYSFFYFVDDDTFVNLENLNRFLDQNQFNKFSWVGEMLSRKTNACNPVFKRYPDLKYMSGGAGYLLTSKLFEGKPFSNYFTGYSDVCLGLNLAKHGYVNLMQDSKFRSQPPHSYVLSDEEIKNAISFHYIKTKEQFEKCLELTPLTI